VEKHPSAEDSAAGTGPGERWAIILREPGGLKNYMADFLLLKFGKINGAEGSF
jgi:hypothetical protein